MQDFIISSIAPFVMAHGGLFLASPFIAIALTVFFAMTDMKEGIRNFLVKASWFVSGTAVAVFAGVCIVLFVAAAG